MQNELERAVLSDVLGPSASLIGTLSVEEGVTSYLEHVKAETGVDYIPTVEPAEDTANFPQ